MVESGSRPSPLSPPLRLSSNVPAQRPPAPTSGRRTIQNRKQPRSRLQRTGRRSCAMSELLSNFRTRPAPREKSSSRLSGPKRPRSPSIGAAWRRTGAGRKCAPDYSRLAISARQSLRSKTARRSSSTISVPSSARNVRRRSAPAVAGHRGFRTICIGTISIVVAH